MAESAGAYGQEFADRFGLESPPTLTARVLRKTEIAVTQIKCDAPNHEPTSPGVFANDRREPRGLAAYGSQLSYPAAIVDHRCPRLPRGSQNG